MVKEGIPATSCYLKSRTGEGTIDFDADSIAKFMLFTFVSRVSSIWPKKEKEEENLNHKVDPIQVNCHRINFT